MKYFLPSEFRHFDKMNTTLLQMLDEMREIAGVPIVVTSSYRTPAENVAAGGVKDSSHLKGLAVDIHVPSNRYRLRYLDAALRVGFRRIGIGSVFMHLDIDDSKPDSIWLY